MAYPRIFASVRWHFVATSFLLFLTIHLRLTGNFNDDPSMETVKSWIPKFPTYRNPIPYDLSLQLAAGNFTPEIFPKPLPNHADEDLDIAICAAMRDVGFDLPEWLQHHYYHIGIRKFYILDDGSTPPIVDTVTELGIPRHSVEFSYSPREKRVPRMQYAIYNECNRRYGDRHTWMGFIDSDEFIEMTGNETLREFLRSFEDEYPDTAAVAMNWLTHNGNGLINTPPRGTCRRSFTSCIGDDGGDGWENSHIKSFVKTKYYRRPMTPHYFALKDNKVARGENGDIVPKSWRTPVTRNRIALHHYAVKSKEQFLLKAKLGSANSNFKTLEWMEFINNRTNMTCDSLANYFP